MASSPDDSEVEGGAGAPVDPYERFPAHRRNIMVAVMAWCGLLSPISSTAILSAIPEVAETFRTTGSMISLSNALYMALMAVSTCFWGPLCQVFGRKTVSPPPPGLQHPPPPAFSTKASSVTNTK